MKEVKLTIPEKQDFNLYKGIDLYDVSFPCLCTFNTCFHERKLGMLNMGYKDGKNLYELHYLIPEGDVNRCQEDYDFKDLLERWDVEFKKGKVIVYDIDE